MDIANFENSPISAADAERIEILFDGKYRLVSPVSKRTKSRVYKGVCAQTGDPLAVKIQDLERGIKGPVAEAISQRLHLFRKIDHPHVTNCVDATFLSPEGTMVMIMDWVEGLSLDSYIEANEDKITIGGLVELLMQVADGIDEIHRHRVIHRDIKPQNVMVHASNRVAKVSDLGVAMGNREGTAANTKTQSCGTPAYMAPEQIIGTSFGNAVDIYSFAVMIYHLLTKCYPFDAKTTQEFVYAHIHADPVPIRWRNRNFPSQLDATLARSLSKPPMLRHQTATELMAEVQEALHPYTPLRLVSYFDGSFSRFSSGEVPINF